jgi:hypothetical protein
VTGEAFLQKVQRKFLKKEGRREAAGEVLSEDPDIGLGTIYTLLTRRFSGATILDDRLGAGCFMYISSNL